jgi:integrase
MIEVVRKAFNLAVRWGWRADNPAMGVHRNREEKRVRYLSAEEILRLSEALAAHPEKTSGSAIRLLMLTGARRGEVLSARWDMFDLEAGVWVKPSAHTKQRKVHRVPLSAAAVALLKEMKPDATSAYVFPGANGKPLTDINPPSPDRTLVVSVRALVLTWD